MKEGFESVMTNQETPEEKLNSLPASERERILKSWSAVKELMESAARLSVENANASKVENRDSTSNFEVSKEIYDFYSHLFKGEENADPMQIEIGITNNFVDTYLARDENGKIATILQSQTVEVPSPTEGGRPELMFLVWYVAASKEYKGRPLTRDLFRLAFSDLLQRGQRETRAIKCLVGEAEDEVEGLFNRYGLKRPYFKDRNGRTKEVPYESPPEDESPKGVPEHLMIRLLDGRETISKEELVRLVQRIYDQYTKPEYFSVEYLKYALEFYGEEGWDINPVSADFYHRRYLQLTASIKEKLERALKKAQGDIFFMSRRERRQLSGDASK